MNDISIKSRWELPVPAPKQLSRDALIDQYTRDSMFRDWDWLDALEVEDMKEIISEVTHACWRGDEATYKDDAERLAAIKSSLLSFIERWAEEEADHED